MSDQATPEQAENRSGAWPTSNEAFYVMPTQTVQALLNYLDTRPHREVRQLIDAIMMFRAKPRPAPVVAEPEADE